MPKKLLLISVLLGLAGCQNLPTSSPHSVEVFKSLNTRQCEVSIGDFSRLQQQLETNKIRVYAATVGHDGMMRIQVCGAPDGKIAIFKINAKQQEQAQKLGFKMYEAK